MRLKLSQEDVTSPLEDIWLRFDEDTIFSPSPYLTMGYTNLFAWIVGGGGSGGGGNVTGDLYWGGGGGGGGGAAASVRLEKYLAALPGVMEIEIGKGALQTDFYGGMSRLDRYSAYGGGRGAPGEYTAGGVGGSGGGGGSGGSHLEHGTMGNYGIGGGAVGLHGAGDGGDGSIPTDRSLVNGTSGDYDAIEIGVSVFAGSGGGGGGRGYTYPDSVEASATAPGVEYNRLLQGPTPILMLGGGYAGGQGAAGGSAHGDSFDEPLYTILGGAINRRPGDGGRGGNGYDNPEFDLRTPAQDGENGCVVIRLSVGGYAL